ncbi:MAG: HDIG domain-containing protein [candidate division Zixibacteria bacterium]|nr:HDIG domain-containing protein [candidate division Zixibacteria bacterium]
MKKSRVSNNNVIKSGELTLEDAKERKYFDKDLLFRVILGAILILGITFLYPLEKLYQPLDVPNMGEVATEDLRAPFDFPIFKSEAELQQDRETVIANLRPVLIYDTLLSQMVSDKALNFFDYIDSSINKNLDNQTTISLIRNHYPALSDSVILSILTESQLIRNTTLSIVDSLISSGIMNNINSLPLQNSGLVTIYGPSEIKTVARDHVLDLSSARIFIANELSKLLKIDAASKKIISDLAFMFLEPNLIFSKEKTEMNRQAEIEAIPKTKGLVFRGELIIKSNERITEVHRDKLVSLAKYKLERLQGKSVINYILPPMGRMFFVAFPILFFIFYLYFFRRKIYNTNSSILVVAILIGAEVLLLNTVLSQNYLSKYLVPLTIASMLATILFDEEVGLILTFSLGLLAGVLSGFKLDITFVTIISGVVASFSVRKVRHRQEFYRPLLYLCLTYGGSVYIIESLKLTPSPELISHVWMSILNGFLSPILTIGLLPLFETGFGITTDVTLLELSDLNRPLLKRLALEAPGTYHHSLMIGTLAEDAAEAIGANSLLARVGSYYHDIGKIQKPEYFVENQSGGVNKHEKLTPTMSAMILEAHVKEGIELALKHNLPKSIIDFITGHHGTSTMTYFYDKSQKEIGDAADVRDFQYPGPNPETKEVAIVMLADSVEAASRTLDDPKPSRIRNLVHRIFMDKFNSGLLEKSNLTLRDLKTIEDSFVRVLIATFHKRIKYPEQKRVLS